MDDLLQVLGSSNNFSLYAPSIIYFWKSSTLSTVRVYIVSTVNTVSKINTVSALNTIVTIGI